MYVDMTSAHASSLKFLNQLYIAHQSIKVCIILFRTYI